MNNALVSNWNKVVAPNDIVFHLGDFCFGDRKTWKSFCSKLNGTKYLIQGNHDRENEIYYEGFELVCDIAQVAIYDNEMEQYIVLDIVIQVLIVKIRLITIIFNIGLYQVMM